MKLRLAVTIYISLATVVIVESTSNGAELWCYDCNTDLNTGRRGDCNDPYTPTATDLVACPRNESHLCLKSLVFYKNVHVTVRGCVPADKRNTYCLVKEAYPDASIECLFCNDYACNTSPPSATSVTNRFPFLLLILVVSFGS